MTGGGKKSGSGRGKTRQQGPRTQGRPSGRRRRCRTPRRRALRLRPQSRPNPRPPRLSLQRRAKEEENKEGPLLAAFVRRDHRCISISVCDLTTRVLFGIGVAAGDEQAARAGFEVDVTERGDGEAVVGAEVVEQAAFAAVGEDLVVDVQEDLGRERFDLEAGLVDDAVGAAEGGAVLAAEAEVEQAAALGDARGWRRRLRSRGRRGFPR